MQTRKNIFQILSVNVDSFRSATPTFTYKIKLMFYLTKNEKINKNMYMLEEQNQITRSLIICIHLIIIGEM